MKKCLKPDCNNPAKNKYCSATCANRHKKMLPGYNKQWGSFGGSI